MDLTIDPEFRDLIPPLTEEEYKGLEESLLTIGFDKTMPIITWKGHNVIVDGHNRYGLCKKHDIEYETVEREFESRYDVIKWMLDIQLNRRSPNKKKRTYVIGRRLLVEKGEWGNFDRINTPKRQNDALAQDGKTSKKIADQLSLGFRTIERAAEFTSAVDRIVQITGIKVNDLLDDNIKGSLEEIKKLSEIEEESLKRIITAILSGAAKDIESASDIIRKEDHAKLLQEIAEKERLAKIQAKKEREEKEAAERERIQKAREERERLEKERQEKERAERERARLEKLERERIKLEQYEKEKAEQERIKKERFERERIEREKCEAARKEKLRIEKERLEKERIELERQKKERLEKERIERELLAKELAVKKAEAEKERIRLEQAHLEKERIRKELEEQAKAEKHRLEVERLEKERIEHEIREKERLEKEKIENERLILEQIEAEKKRKEQLEKERIENERIEKERIEKEKAEQLKREQLRIEQERADKEKLVQIKLEQARIEKEKLEKLREERERIEAEFKISEAKRKPAASFNSGNNEWYTPEPYIKAATDVMGCIDLDPASSIVANKVVGAKTFYSAEDDGLEKEWAGKVWMNPPYSGEFISQFSEKITKHYNAGEITEAIVLVNNATETTWFNTLVKVASAIVFPCSRVKFYAPDGKIAAPLQGQAVVYMGSNPELFIDKFKQFGWGAKIEI
jgi:hypothetical protein